MMCLAVSGLMGCATVGKKSADGNTISIKGSGKVVFADESSIEGKTWLPEFKVFR